MSSFDEISAFAKARLDDLEAKNLRRQLRPTDRRASGESWCDGARLISFCDNDYLGLSHDKDVIAAGAAAARTYGAGAGASRLVTGDCPLNTQLEEKIAAMKSMPAARLFGAGYLANIGTIPVLARAGDLILLDELSHSCLHAGAQLSGADIVRFRHNDVDHARQILLEQRPEGGILILTETVFSMDGDLAPLGALDELAREFGAWLMTDDAHGFGVVKIDNPAPVQMGTLSKAVGCYGGYVCGPKPLIDLLASRARSFVYTTGLPPGVLGSALQALEIIDKNDTLGERARANAKRFAELIGAPPPPASIVPLVIGDEQNALALSNQLEQEGFLVTAIRPPTVPEGTARLRFTFSADHRESDIDRLASVVQTTVNENQNSVAARA